MASETSLCAYCERRERWLDPRRPGGWSVCHQCISWHLACMRRRREAAYRLPRLDCGVRDPWLVTA